MSALTRWLHFLVMPAETVLTTPSNDDTQPCLPVDVIERFHPMDYDDLCQMCGATVNTLPDGSLKCFKCGWTKEAHNE